MNSAVEVVKRAAMEAFNASMPTTVMFGTVINTFPLKVQVDQKTILTSAFLVLSSLVSDFNTTMVMDGVTKTVTMKFGLTVGEKVIMIRQQGGQKFLVLDRAR